MELLPILYIDGVTIFYLLYSKFRTFRVSKIRIGCPKDGCMGLWLKPSPVILTHSNTSKYKSKVTVINTLISYCGVSPRFLGDTHYVMNFGVSP